MPNRMFLHVGSVVGNHEHLQATLTTILKRTQKQIRRSSLLVSPSDSNFCIVNLRTTLRRTGLTLYPGLTLEIVHGDIKGVSDIYDNVTNHDLYVDE